MEICLAGEIHMKMIRMAVYIYISTNDKGIRLSKRLNNLTLLILTRTIWYIFKSTLHLIIYHYHSVLFSIYRRGRCQSWNSRYSTPSDICGTLPAAIGKAGFFHRLTSDRRSPRVLCRWLALRAACRKYLESG